MGMSASQARFLSVTSRISDLGLRGQSIAEQRIRLSMDMEGIGKAYNQDISDRRLYTDTTNFVGGDTYGNRDFISYANLLEQGLYVFDGEKVLGYGEKTGVVGKETYISGYENDMNRPNGWDKMLAVVGQENDLSKPIAWNKMLVDDVTKPIEFAKKQIDDKSRPLTWAPMTIPGAHHPAQVTPINQTTAADCKPASRSDNPAMYDNLTSVLATAGITNPNDAQIIKYNTAVKNAQGQYEYKEVVSLAIKNDAAMKKLNATNAFNTAAGLKGNYVLLGDMNLSGANWNAIGGANGSFTGMFDGNQHSVNNMTINFDGAGNKRFQGLFGNNAGTIKGVNLNNASIKLDSAVNGSVYQWQGYVGGIAGLNNGLVENCNVSGIKIVIDGDADEVGTVVGNNGANSTSAVIDKCSGSGSISVGGNAGDIGGLAGWLQGGTVTRSSSDVNINVAGGTKYGAVFIGDGNGSFENCFSTGSFNTGSNAGNCSGGMTGDNGSTINNSFVYQNGQYKVFDNGSTTASSNTGNCNDFKGQFKDDRGYVTINGQQVPVWLFPGEPGNSGSTPILNNAAVNVVTLEAYDDPDQIVDDKSKPLTWAQMEVDDTTNPIRWEKKSVDDLSNPTAWAQKDVMGYVDDKTKPNSWEQNPVYSERDVYGPVMDMDKEVIGMTSENLEYGLRSGKLQLYKMADEFSNTVKEFGNSKFQPISWQTCTVISDDLYKDNDAQAQAKYDVEMKKLQTKDKRLELEQKNVDTEYKALTTEHDSIKKVIDKNIETSFKMFG